VFTHAAKHASEILIDHAPASSIFYKPFSVKRSSRSIAYYFYCWFLAYGIDLNRTWKALRFTPRFFLDYIRFKALARSQGSEDWAISISRPQLSDWGESGGTARGHYFHQDLHVARRVYEANPRRHIDVGSRVDGFVAHVATFRDIEVLDIRPNVQGVHRIRFSQCDLMNPPPGMEHLCDSLSCLHALEHFGLGRYGDPLDPSGHLSGFAGLARLLTSKGILYFSVPIGRQRIEFNAHRVFSVETILKLAQEWFTLERFAYVDDLGDFHEQGSAEIPSPAKTLEYGCGIFEFRKKEHSPSRT
jgi:hypothetical protein